jgi:hypothetical protein
MHDKVPGLHACISSAARPLPRNEGEKYLAVQVLGNIVGKRAHFRLHCGRDLAGLEREQAGR